MFIIETGETAQSEGHAQINTVLTMLSSKNHRNVPKIENQHCTHISAHALKKRCCCCPVLRTLDEI